MSFKYSIAHIQFDQTNTKKDLIDLLNQHDENSFLYSLSTAQLNMSIAKELHLSDEEVYIYFQCGFFHDIGKLGMSYEFINYPSSYTMEMYQEMKKHPQGGATILENIKAEKELIETAMYHHCNYDGTGYPGGLYDEEIPLHARITRVSDSVDAFMSKRCYKEGGPTYEVMNDLNQYKRSSYDPYVLAAFSFVHDNILSNSHKMGVDRPSQEMYMSILNKLYGTKEIERFVHEFLDDSYLKNLSI